MFQREVYITFMIVTEVAVSVLNYTEITFFPPSCHSENIVVYHITTKNYNQSIIKI